MTESAGVRGLPRSLNGVPVLIKVTGAFHAVPKPDCNVDPNHPSCKDDPPPEEDPPADVDPTSRFDRPVPIGVSTGNEGECSAGTIGARVTDGIDVWALSNNHVYALENDAPLGSDVHQPGRYDTNCATDPNNVIGTLDDFEPIVFSTSANNTIDAAIALSSTADLGNATPTDGYGTPSSQTVEPALGLLVQKFGRTTSLTYGEVTIINVMVNVGYISGTARFVDQIIVQSGKGPFLKSGDSGSLVVTDDEFRNPVGLLFAGNKSGKLGVVNPIDDVLAAFGVSIDDGPL